MPDPWNPNASCETCRCWERHPESDKDIDTDSGWCHRFPPTTIYIPQEQDILHVKASTSSGYWCREWQDRDQPAKDAANSAALDKSIAQIRKEEMQRVEDMYTMWGKLKDKP